MLSWLHCGMPWRLHMYVGMPERLQQEWGMHYSSWYCWWHVAKSTRGGCQCCTRWFWKLLDLKSSVRWRWLPSPKIQNLNPTCLAVNSFCASCDYSLMAAHFASNSLVLVLALEYMSHDFATAYLLCQGTTCCVRFASAYLSCFWPICCMWFASAYLPWLLPRRCMCFATAYGLSCAEEVITRNAPTAQPDVAQRATKAHSAFWQQVLNSSSQCKLWTQVLNARFECKVITEAAEAGEPLLFFCKIGKDRTGVLAALLLSCCGAKPEEIIADYHRCSSSCLWGAYSNCLIGLSSERTSNRKKRKVYAFQRS